jgi:NADPH:quinone reductase-like Zn-dependent oxidoreductase
MPSKQRERCLTKQKQNTSPQISASRSMASLPMQMNVLLSDTRDNRSFLDFSVVRRPTPIIQKPTDIIIEMHAAPINPSDIGVIFGASRRFNAVQNGPSCISAPIDEGVRGSFEFDIYGNPRAGGIVCGNEGSGIVVAAGDSEQAQAMLGKTVAVFGSGGCYATYRKASARGNSVNVMPAGVSPRDAASSFVNPLTVLGMLSTAKEGGHTSLVHTAAASQLGQMMLRVCTHDNIPLVNVVRRPEQEQLLRSINSAAVIVSQASPTFEADLTQAIKQTGATIAFDATGGGALSAQLLDAIDAAGHATEGHQLYNYGALDTSPSTLSKEQRARTGFWLLPMWAAKAKPLFASSMKRVASEITTTFATTYTAEVGMAQAVTLPALQVYARQQTGKKYLLNPFTTAVAKL